MKKDKEDQLMKQTMLEMNLKEKIIKSKKIIQKYKTNQKIIL